MKFFKAAVLAALVMTSSAYAQFGINLGPFSLQFGGYGGPYISAHRNILDQPICYAIENQNRLDITVEGVDIVNTKEKKVVVKRIIVEPYAFGVTKDGSPVLRGNVVEEKLVKEVSVKFGDDKFEEPKAQPSEKGNFTGKLTTGKNQNIDIKRVVAIDVVDDWHFDAPKDFKGVDEENFRVICQLPVEKK